MSQSCPVAARSNPKDSIRGNHRKKAINQAVGDRAPVLVAGNVLCLTLVDKAVRHG